MKEYEEEQKTNMGVMSRMRVHPTLGLFSIQLLCASLVLKIIQSFLSRRINLKKTSQSLQEEIQLDMAFVRRLLSLLKICIPGILSIELAGALGLSILLFLSSKLTIFVAEIVGKNGKFLIERKIKSFIFGVADLALLAIPRTILPIASRYTKVMLQERLRDKLQQTLQVQYLSGNNVYFIATQHTLDNPDYRITENVKTFCTELSDIFQSIMKPLLEIITFSLAFLRVGGFSAPGVLMSYYVFVAVLMSMFLPNFAKLFALSQEKEANLIATHGQLVQHAEEVAFYGGEEIEREHADSLIKSILRHERRIKYLKWYSALFDSFLIKYGAVYIGYIVCGVLTLSQKDLLSKPDLARLYLQSTQLYVPLSDAIAKIFLLHKKIGALCGSTNRVCELLEMLQRTSLNSQVQNVRNVFVEKGCTNIIFNKANIESLDGIVLIKDLNLIISPGKHLLIMGSNGSGKSALIRVLSELWPLYEGTIKKPPPGEMIFLPQKAYLPPGTLRAQMVYPLTEEEAIGKNITDDKLISYADSLGIAYVIEREGGLDAVKKWHEIFSGGERQRVALMRVLVQHPMFAFLDECTSAISQDEEPRLYTQLQKAGVTLITISHRDALKALHHELLEVHGNGSYSLKKLH